MPIFGRVAIAASLVAASLAAGPAGPALAIRADAASLPQVTPPPAPGATAVPAGAAVAVPRPAADGEIVALRTRTSRTFATNGGAYTAHLYAGPVNFRDIGGGWQKIDTRFVPATGGYRTAANDLVVEAPAQAAGAVRVSGGGSWLSYRLRGANGAGTVSGNAITYRDAFPATSVELRSEAEQAKETLTLANASAPSAFLYDVEAAPGLTPRLRDKAVEFVGNDGKARFTFAPPWMKDSASAGTISTDLRYTVVPAARGWTVALTLDRAWLANPARVWPVVVDPTTAIAYAAQNTYVNSASPSTNYSGGTTLKAGMNADGVNSYRTLLQFEVAGTIPKGAHVLSSRLRLKARTTGTMGIGVYRVNRTWSNSATWNTYDGTSSWTAAGGDTTGSSYWVASSFANGSSASWYIPALVKGWVDGTIPNHGVLLKPTTSGTTTIDFDSSTGSDPVRMDLTYSSRTGIRPFYTYDTRSLTDRSNVRVNVATGNLVLANDDLAIKGTGLDLKIGRFYNSRSDAPLTAGPFPTKWTLSPGRDLRIDRYSDGALLTGPSDYKAWFVRAGSSYKAPSGENADLVRHADDSFTLTYRKSGVKFEFDASGRLTENEDRNGQSITVAYNTSSQTTSITDTQGRAVSFTYTNGKLTRLTDSTNRQWDYGYDSTNTYLTSYTDPGDGTNRGVTYYAYNTAGLLSQVTDPRGEVTQFTYDLLSRVTTIKHVTDDPNDTDPVTTYTYNDGSTIVNDANNRDTTYFYDVESRVTRIENPLGDTRKREYNANSDVTSSTAGASADNSVAGDSTTSTYDPVTGNITQTTLPTSASVQMDYSAAGSATQYVPAGRTDTQGNHTTFTYDARNNLKTAKDDTSTAELKYDRQGDGTTTCGAKTGQICKQTDPNGKETTFGYDSQGNLTSMTPPSPLVAQTFTPDSLSRVVTVVDGRTQTTSYTYDPLDRLKRVDYNDGTNVQYTYDRNGNLVTRVDATGTTTYTYDERNRMTVQNLPGSLSLTYAYDKVGNLTSFTDATGSTTYAYDAANQLKQLTEPGGTCTGTPKLKCTTYTYNRKGQRATVTYPNAVEMRLTYDASGRQTEVLSSNTLGDLLKYTYGYSKNNSDTGLRQFTTGPNGEKTHYTYDSLNRVTKASAHAELIDADDPIAWYRLGETSGTTAADSSGNSVDGTYSSTGVTKDVNGAVAGETDQAARFDGSTGKVSVPDQSSLRLNGSFTIEFNAKMTSFANTYPGILRKGESYTGKTGYVIWYESNGNVHFKRDGQDVVTTGSGGLVTDRFRHFAITYDGLTARFFVDGVQKSSATALFNSNIELGPLEIGKGDNTNYGNEAIDEVALYNKALTPTDVARHAAAVNLGARYTYDKAGNRTKQNDTFSRGLGAAANENTYTYNDASQVTARNGSSSYSYDGNGNETAGLGQYTRTSTTYNAKEQATSFSTSNGTLSSTYAGGDQFERFTSGGLTFENSNLLGITATRPGGNGTATYYSRDPSGALHSVHLGSSPNAATYYYLFDGQGSVVGLTNSTGSLVNKYTYDPYGQILTKTEAVANPFRYIGGYDDSTGLTKFGLRYYDPTLGRFTQQDPVRTIGDPSSSNMYAYSDCNPTNRSDPSGAIDWGAVWDDAVEGAKNTGEAAAVGGFVLGCITGGIGGAVAGGAVGGPVGAVGGAIVGCAVTGGKIGGHFGAVGATLGGIHGAIFGDRE